jgi:hypothetical protein
MAANTLPIYSKQGQINWSTSVLKTANTAIDGTGSPLVFFTADASNGGRVERIRVNPLGTNIATVIRIFINNGGDTEVAANNILYAELTAAATTVSQVARLVNNEVPSTVDTTSFPLILPPGYRLTATCGTTVAAGFSVMAVGGSY